MGKWSNPAFSFSTAALENRKFEIGQKVNHQFVNYDVSMYKIPIYNDFIISIKRVQTSAR